MSSQAIHEQTNTVEREPIPELTELAVTILDAHEIEPISATDGAKTRELEGHKRKLTEVTSSEGVRSFSFTEAITFLDPFDTGMETATWGEGSSRVDYTFDGEETGQYKATLGDSDHIDTIAGHLGGAFRLPEKEPEKRPSKFKAFLGRLSFK